FGWQDWDPEQYELCIWPVTLVFAQEKAVIAKLFTDLRETQFVNRCLVLNNFIQALINECVIEVTNTFALCDEYCHRRHPFAPTGKRHLDLTAGTTFARLINRLSQCLLKSVAS